MTRSIPVRTLLVDDSPFALAKLGRQLSGFPEIEVVGTARSGREALSLIPVLNPVVVCTELEMPIMNGLDLTRTIMSDCPRSVLVVSGKILGDKKGIVDRSFAAGAVDVHFKPAAGLDWEDRHSVAELVGKIKAAAGVVPLLRRLVPYESPLEPRNAGDPRRDLQIVAIGASVGGPQALNTILRALPGDFPSPILCVQHIGAGFLDSLIGWLGADSELRIKKAESGELPRQGTVYFPEEGTHLVVDRNGRLSSSKEPPVNGHRPSVTVTFKSVAVYYGRTAGGVLLTGMGEDGCDGLKAIADAGGLTIAQNEKTSVVFGMPRRAIELGAARQILPIGRIAEALLSQTLQKQEQS